MSSFINFLYNLVGGSNLSDKLKIKPITLKKNYLKEDGKFNPELITEYMEDILSQIADKIKLEDGIIPNNLSLLIGENNKMLDKDGVPIVTKDKHSQVFDFVMEFENLEEIQPNNFDLICVGPDFETLKKYFSGCFEKIIINLAKTHLIPELNLYIANCIDLLKINGKLLIDGNNYVSNTRIIHDLNCQYETVVPILSVNKLKKNTHGKYILNIGKSDKIAINSYEKFKFPDKLLEIQKKAIESNSDSVLSVTIIDNSKVSYLHYVDNTFFSLDNFKYFECEKKKKIEPIKILDNNKVLINEKYIIDLDKHKKVPVDPTLDSLNKFRFVHKKEKAF